MPVHALTVDLEDWHQLLRQRITGTLLPASTAVVRDTHRLLDLLEETHVRATFFVLGSVAERYPELVRELVRRGHEVGSHTYRHELIYRMTPNTFRRDIIRAKAQLEDLTGQSVIGFRAPEFSVERLDHWSFAILAELGFRYDSSVFPVPGARYGIPEAPQHPFVIATPAGHIHEFPLATWTVGARRLPVAGGSYFRLLPARLLQRAFHDLDEDGATAVLYFHPYEFHRGWLAVKKLSWRQRLRPSTMKYTLLHNACTRQIAGRLQSLLRRYSFQPLGEIYRQRVVGARLTERIAGPY